jgi:hypothetical protein
MSMFTYNYSTNFCFSDLRVPLVLVCCCRHFLRPVSPLQVHGRRSYQTSSLLHKLSCYYCQFYSLHSLLSHVLQRFMCFWIRSNMKWVFKEVSHAYTVIFTKKIGYVEVAKVDIYSVHRNIVLNQNKSRLCVFGTAGFVKCLAKS